MTKTNDKNQNREFKFMAYHDRAVELRYQGKTYAEIALLLTDEFKKDFRDDRIRKWFSLSTGILAHKYLEYARMENDRRRQVIMEELKKVAGRIPATFDLLLDRKYQDGTPKADMTTVAALKLACEVMGFKIEPMDPVGDPLDDYFSMAEKIVAAKKELPPANGSAPTPGTVS